MKTANKSKSISYLQKVFFVLFFLTGSFLVFSQEEQEEVQDSTKTGASLGRIELKNPDNIISKYTYDPLLDRYIYTESVADFDISYPVILTPEQYYDLILKESMRDYFKDKTDAISGNKEGSEEARKNLLPQFYVNSNFFETIFGGNTIEVIPQGSVAMDLGIRLQKNDNPALSPRNRSNLSFDFDQRISLSMLGKVGTKLQITANYDTEATFDFQNLIKLEYTPTEDDILQKIEVGNVSMPLNSSLINGAQSLFGVKTQLKFGKTTVTGVFSEQRSQSRNIVAQGGGTINEYEILALDYDEDRHFFLSHFFRDQYDTALENYPFIRSQVQITRIEVWVTNRTQSTNNVRNIVGIQDLGEPVPENTRIYIQTGQNPPAGFFNNPSNLLPRNNANDYNPLGIDGTEDSVLTPAIRDVATVESGFGSLSSQVNQGFDYAFLENARKLEQGTDFTLNTQLGYISLNQRLSSDEVLGVAYQYTYAGEVYQVGEFANDGVNATEYTETNGVVTAVNSQSLVLKLLKSNITNVSDPIWDLMMKNIYATGAFQLLQEDFKLNILYTDPSPVNYISPVDEATWPDGLEEQILLDVFNFDRLNVYNDPQNGGDGFFDYISGTTVDPQNGRIIFTKVEPFGEYLYERLGGGTFYESSEVVYNQNANPNQLKYVFRNMYQSTKADAYEDSDKNKFLLKGKYKSEGGTGIPLGAFNVPRGSVKVTAGGRVLQEGIDYTVNYQAGTVQILDESLQASNVPINVSVENNAVFGQQTRRFMGVNVEHQFNENFMIGATLLNLKERPLTQKANFGVEPVNNTIFGFNGNFSTEVPFLTRLVNKLPNIDTDAPSNLSVRGEFAYLIPGSPKAADFEGETTSYLDDFEGAQSLIDIRTPLAWSLASVPLEFYNDTYSQPDDPGYLESGYQRAKLAWYTIDPIFYTGQRPGGISDNDVSLNATRRIFIDEIFPEVDIAQGQTTVQSTLDLAYYPNRKGPYNNNTNSDFSSDVQNNWGGIMRPLTSTNFEQSNVEYIQFWMLDPYYLDGPLPTQGGELIFNLGNISEDILKDGLKQFENGLPGTGTSITRQSAWGEVPSGQSLVYAFDADNANRNAQDIGFDGLNDAEESSIYTNNGGTDPALDNYQYYLNAQGSVLERYLNYNNTEGNSPITVTNTNRGSTTIPDVEDVDRDLTMNTVNSYFEYRIPVSANTTKYVTDTKIVRVSTPDNNEYSVRWLQFKVPVKSYDEAVGGITDLRSVSFMRMYLTGFNEDVVLRFATLDLVRGDWRSYTKALNEEIGIDENVNVDVSAVNIQENEDRIPIAYILPRGVRREQLNNNNTIINVNEQSLAFSICELEPEDSKAVFKNVNIDLRQYKKIKMFIHAEAKVNPDNPGGQPDNLNDGELIGFLRLGTDFDQNYYQIEVPLSPTPYSTGIVNRLSAEAVWPVENDIDVSLDVLSKIKAIVLENQDMDPSEANFFDKDLNTIGEFSSLQVTSQDKNYRYGIKGNPSLGNIRSIMVGVKNGNQGGGDDVCGEVWFNELRVAELDNKGGWASIAALDANLADFANVSATGRISTIGFGDIEDTPNERSREKAVQYSVNTNVNLGQLLPPEWGIQLPLNYSISEELITPEFDPLYQDLKLQDRIDAAETQEQKDQIRERAEDYTKRTSINFIGIRKNRAAEKKPHFYDVENFTLNYAYNELNHRDFEIERLTDQNVRAGVTYSYNFRPAEIEPFKKNDSIFRSKYWKWLKDLNLNVLPASISFNSNITRSLNRQSFRQVTDSDINSEDFIVPELQQRNYLFDWQYAINYNLTKSLRFNFTASNNFIVKNYFIEDEEGNLIINKDLGLWSGFFDTGDPNRHAQELQVNYELPLEKIPFLSFINGTYAYTSNFDWQRGSDVLNDIAGENLNTVQNAATHNLTTSLTMDRLYSYLGFVKKGSQKNKRSLQRPNPTMPARTVKTDKNAKSSKDNIGIKIYNTAVDVFGMIKRINVSYTKNSGIVLPGYLRSPGFIGTIKPSLGFVFGSQADVRYEAAKKGWLTTFDEFNQQYTQREATQLNISANAQPMKDLTIDFVANRQYSESYTENFSVTNGVYTPLTPNTYGDFSISAFMLKTAFKKSDANNSETFDEFRNNRLTIAQRLAGEPIDPNADFPTGYGATNQAVLLPAFVAAYTGQDAENVKLGAFRDVPIPNWTIKYTGLMNIDWFQKKFRRFSLTHGYRSSYSINSFRTNLTKLQADATPTTTDDFDDSGNYLNENLYSNVTLVEQFNPLLKVDFEMKNSINVQAEIKKDRALSMSFDNNLLTEVNGKEYIIGLGYRFKDVRITTNMGGNKTTLKGDLNLKADLSLRDNITIIRNLDINTNQITSGQNVWTLKFTADYALNKNLTALFFYDHTFSEFKVSTAFPQTTIRSGITLRYNFGN
ncbi:cell surface protein SprA [Abyssalbus ytuae]|uniref:Cell surface protein SprA n=1 Tax=Abyssalbus ytuae TaxID=2926907 RepID=A0A9E7D4I9_9FLAO|nr:cell surface protein SprA [Abyssalbus ytuae]UOB18984.1 cell surface protein SprA [Abyssalbus ytuae]